MRLVCFIERSVEYTMNKNVAVLAGDGIGPEVIAEGLANRETLETKQEKSE